jgi:hypothetical protein
MASSTTVRVRLLIFSGRPDPEWDVDDAIARDLAAHVSKALGGAEAQPPRAPGLGYRGFQFALPSDGIEDVVVSQGVVTVRRTGKVDHKRDDGGLEQFLLDQARRRGLDKLIDAATKK